jgi:hypothetical protein
VFPAPWDRVVSGAVTRNAYRLVAKLDLVGLCRRKSLPPIPDEPGPPYTVHSELKTLQKLRDICAAILEGKAAQVEPDKKRSWTQPELDDAIREYRATRASTYKDLVAAVRKGRRGAVESARKIYGRNAIAKALGVRAASMISKSNVWQHIAEELRLNRAYEQSLPRRKRIGLEAALERKAVEIATTNQDPEEEPDPAAAARQIPPEMLAQIRSTLGGDVAEAAIEKLARGEIDNNQLAEIIRLAQDQSRDDRSRRSSRLP